MLENKYDDLMSPVSQLARKTEFLSLDDVPADQSDQEYMLTPLPNRKLQTLNRHITSLSDGRVSPVRFQLSQPIAEVARSTRSYIKRKANEVVTATLECIAPGQSTELVQLIAGPSTMDNKAENDVVKTLISLYNGATSRAIKLTLLSIFVQHYTKTQLKEMVPGLTTWRIDEARKYAAAEEICEEKGPVIRYRLDEKKVDHFMDFISSPCYLQDVAYGTRRLKLSNGEVIEVPNMVRTVMNSRMIMLYESYCRETCFKPLGRSTLFTILKVCV